MARQFWRRLRFSLNSLRAQLILWVALPVAVSLLAISLMEVRGHEQAMQRLVRERADGLTQAAAALISARLDRGQDALLRLAGDPALHVAEDEELPALLAAAVTKFSLFPAGLAIYAADGVPLAASPTASWSRQPQVATMVQAVLHGQRSENLTLNDGEDQGWLLLQAVPVAYRGAPAVRALVGATPVNSLALSDLIQVLAFSPAAKLHVEGADGTRLIELVGDRSADTAPKPGKIVTAHGHVDPVGWHIVLQESWADLVPPVLRFENAVFVVVVVAVVVSLLSVYFGLRGIVRPLQRLDWAASQVGWGDFEVIQQSVGGVEEIEELRLALARMAGQVRQYQQKLQSYIGAMTLGQEEERKRLARELHDETVQALIVLNQQVELVERRLVQDPQNAAQRLRELRPLIGEAIAGVRRQVHDLRPLYLEDLGFVPALEMLTRQITQHHHLIGDFEISGRPQRRLPPAVEISAYRIVQEALRNVVTHTEASWVHVELVFDSEGITLRIEDDGSGFDAPTHPYQLAQQGHYGLLGMQERAQQHGGWLHIESEAGKGTTVIARLVAPVVDAGKECQEISRP